MKDIHSLESAQIRAIKCTKLVPLLKNILGSFADATSLYWQKTRGIVLGGLSPLANAKGLPISHLAQGPPPCFCDVTNVYH